MSALAKVHQKWSLWTTTHDKKHFGQLTANNPHFVVTKLQKPILPTARGTPQEAVGRLIDT